MEVVRHCLTTSSLKVGSCQRESGSSQTLSSNFQFEGFKLSDSNWKFSVGVLTTSSREEGRESGVVQGKEEGEGMEGRGGIT